MADDINLCLIAFPNRFNQKTKISPAKAAKLSAKGMQQI